MSYELLHSRFTVWLTPGSPLTWQLRVSHRQMQTPALTSSYSLSPPYRTLTQSTTYVHPSANTSETCVQLPEVHSILRFFTNLLWKK